MVPMLVLVLELGLVLGRVLQLAAAVRGKTEGAVVGAEQCIAVAAAAYRKQRSCGVYTYPLGCF